MHQYFYRKDSDQFGPFNLQELKQHDIQQDTYVWYYGLEQWTQVQYIDHLMSALYIPEGNEQEFIENESTPPPLQKRIITERPPIPKNWILESVLITILCCFFPVGIVAIVNGSRVESRYYSGQYEQATKYSKKAEKWFYIAIISNIILIFVTFIYQFIKL